MRPLCRPWPSWSIRFCLGWLLRVRRRNRKEPHSLRQQRRARKPSRSRRRRLKFRRVRLRLAMPTSASVNQNWRRRGRAGNKFASPVAETLAPQVEQLSSPQLEAEEENGGQEESVASIVDSVLADLKPRLME